MTLATQKTWVVAGVVGVVAVLLLVIVLVATSGDGHNDAASPQQDPGHNLTQLLLKQQMAFLKENLTRQIELLVTKLEAGSDDNMIAGFTSLADQLHNLTDAVMAFKGNDTKSDEVKFCKKIGGISCYVLRQDKLSWTSARDYCMAIGGDLAYAPNFITLRNFLNPREGERVWVGLKSRAWLDGRAVPEVEWLAGEPNHAETACGYMNKDTQTYLVADFPCSTTYKYLCQTF